MSSNNVGHVSNNVQNGKVIPLQARCGPEGGVEV